MNDREKIKIMTVLMKHIHEYEDWKEALKELGLNDELKVFDIVRDKLLSMSEVIDLEVGNGK